MSTLEFHPLANIFPLMEGAEFDELVADIKTNGLREPIILYEGMILDGRNRYRACIEADVEPDFQSDGQRWRAMAPPGSRALTFDPKFPESPPIRTVKVGDPLAYVISANIHRRHLTQDQKRELVAKLVKAQPEKSDRQLAQIAKVDHKTVGTARAESEGRGEIPHVESRTDTKGRQQPAKKKSRKRGTTYLLEDEHGTPRRVAKAVIEAAAPSHEEESNVRPSHKELEERQDAARIRDFLRRAENAFEGAKADDMRFIQVTKEMCEAAKEAANAWAKQFNNLMNMRGQRRGNLTPLPTVQEESQP